MNEIYDIIIIGGGPGGLTAGIYAKRAGLKTLLLEKFILGGQVNLASTIENYPGFPEGIKGSQLVDNLIQQVKNFDLEILYKEVNNIEKQQNENIFKVYTVDNIIFLTKSVIIATGTIHKKLNLINEEKLIGAGISFCATCDAPFYKDKIVCVVGGGDTALTEALYLTKFAQKVYIIHRRDEFRGTKILQDRVLNNKKIELLLNSIVTEIIGDDKLKKIVLKNVKTEEKKELECNGMFIGIGFKPNTDFLKNKIWLDSNGYILTDENMQTSLKGIYACGDCRKNVLKQIITTCAEAAISVISCKNYIEQIK